MPARRRLLAAALLVPLPLWLGGCGESNPLIGAWRVDDGASLIGQALGLIGLADRIEFTADKLLVGSSFYRVDYEMGAGRVIVAIRDPNPPINGFVARLLEDGRIALDLPAGQSLIYRRIAPTP